MRYLKATHFNLMTLQKKVLWQYKGHMRTSFHVKVSSTTDPINSYNYTNTVQKTLIWLDDFIYNTLDCFQAASQCQCWIFIDYETTSISAINVIINSNSITVSMLQCSSIMKLYKGIKIVHKVQHCYNKHFWKKPSTFLKILKPWQIN